MGLFKIVLFAAICASAVAEVAVIDACPEIPADVCQVSEARITPCKKNKNCVFTKGKDATLTFDFTPNFAAQKLKTGVYWANGAVELPFEGLGSNDACTYTTCPLEVGKSQTFSYNLHVSKKLPTGVYPLKWKVWNEDNPQQICCFKTTIQLRK